MEKTISLFQYIKASNKPGQFIDVSNHLTDLGYSSYASKREFLEELKANGYLRISDPPLDMYRVDRQLGIQRNNYTDGLDVQLTTQGEQYLADHIRNEANTVSNKEVAYGTIGSGIVAILALVFGVYQYFKNREKDAIIEKQNITIAQTQTELDSLRSQIQLIRQTPKTKQLPLKSQTKNDSSK